MSMPFLESNHDNPPLERQTYAALEDDGLLNRLRGAVAQERNALQSVLYLLHEVDKRQLHLRRGYSSLFAFLTQALGYSEGSAQRRILGMRLLKSLSPKLRENVEEDLRSGALSLSTISQAQSVFQKDKAAFQSPEHRVAVLDSLKGKSRLDVQRQLLAQSPVAAAAAAKGMGGDQIKVIGPEMTRLQVTVDQKTLQTLGQLQMMLSHQLSDPTSYSELVAKLAQVALEALTAKQKGRVQNRAGANGDVVKRGAVTAQAQDKTTDGLPPVVVKAKHEPRERGPQEQNEQLQKSQSDALYSATVMKVGAGSRMSCKGAAACKVAPPLSSSKPSKPSNPSKPSRYIPAAIRRQVMTRDNSCCSYQDSQTGKVCGSQYQLEIDHRTPFALGGPSTVENLRVRCFNHNKYHAQDVFGVRHWGQNALSRGGAEWRSR